MAPADVRYRRWFCESDFLEVALYQKFTTTPNIPYENQNTPKSLRFTQPVDWHGYVSVRCTAVFATPYATCLTNSGGIISFRLNEDADNVKIIYDGGATTNDLGALSKGLQTVPLSITGTFRIQVSKAAGAGYLQGTVNQISVNANNLVKSTNQRGLVVNKNPASPYFGRIYVSVGSRGTNNSRIVSDGIYLLNADQTDAVGQGDTPRTGGSSSIFTPRMPKARDAWLLDPMTTSTSLTGPTLTADYG